MYSNAMPDEKSHEYANMRAYQLQKESAAAMERMAADRARILAALHELNRGAGVFLTSALVDEACRAQALYDTHFACLTRALTLSNELLIDARDGIMTSRALKQKQLERTRAKETALRRARDEKAQEAAMYRQRCEIATTALAQARAAAADKDRLLLARDIENAALRARLAKNQQQAQQQKQKQQQAQQPPAHPTANSAMQPPAKTGEVKAAAAPAGKSDKRIPQEVAATPSKVATENERPPPSHAPAALPHDVADGANAQTEVKAEGNAPVKTTTTATATGRHGPKTTRTPRQRATTTATTAKPQNRVAHDHQAKARPSPQAPRNSDAAARQALRVRRSTTATTPHASLEEAKPSNKPAKKPTAKTPWK